MSPNYQDLQRRGFLVIPGFLTSDMLTGLRDDFARQPLADNRNYGLSMPSAHATATLLPLVREVLQTVRTETDLRPDSPAGAAYFATGRGVNFAWHQDHESFFSQQNHYDYLNFYVPIVKPRVDKSNLSIVPFDVLERECPKTYRRVVRGGAARFIRVGTRRLVFRDDAGTVHLMRRDIETMAETPFLSAGDLLLLRGDMIHRTQDAETERVALSLRATSSTTIVRRRQLANGGWHKAQMMAKNAAVYQHMFETFERARRDELPLNELTALMRASAEPPAKGRRAFMKLLLAEKRRAGVLGRFVPKVAVDAVAEGRSRSCARGACLKGHARRLSHPGASIVSEQQPSVATAAPEGRAAVAGAKIRDLQTRGFLVVPSFLDAQELDLFRADYGRQPAGAIKHYNHGAASAEANAYITTRVMEVLARVNTETDLRVDHPWAGIYFATKRGIDFPWHQDHEAYFSFQNHYDYLNFYIPIVKPQRDKSNLCIVPFDVLERESPETYAKVVRHGASRWIRENGRTTVFLDDEGTEHRMMKDVQSLACTPQLGAGDLLLLRGDIVHRTEDTETDRVALSFRASSSKAIVTRQALAKGSLYKARMMARNALVSEAMFKAFDVAGTDRLEAHQLKALMGQVGLERAKSPRAFMRYLLGEKRRAGVLGGFIARTIVSEGRLRLAAMAGRQGQ